MADNKYAGTQTEKNLQEAFAGESQARNKYTYFASVAVSYTHLKANEEKEKMNELLTEMEHITEISKEIGNIITDIEDIEMCIRDREK